MRHIDQISLVSLQGHIFLQGKKDNEFDGMLCFFVPFFFRHAFGSYGNEEEIVVIKLLCKKEGTKE